MCKKPLLMMLLLALLVPWAANAQTRETQTFDFEDGAIPSTWTNDADYPWVVVSESQGSGHSGTYCIKSGNSGVSSSSSTISATFNFNDDGTISFLGGCFGEGSSTAWDKCIFSIDDTQQFAYGARQTWETYTFNVTAGEHTFTWSFTKDSSVNATGDAFFVDDIVVDLGEVPACPKPTGLTVSNVSTRSATLSWTSDGNAWQIGYSNDNFATEQYVDVTETSYTLTGLAPETAYQVRVQNNCGGGTYSVFTNPVSFTTAVACPAPTGLAAALTPGNGSVATLSWTSDASAWVVAYKTADATDFTEVNVTENPYTLTSLTPETTYNAKVKAVCGGEDGESSWSNTITFTPTNAYRHTVNDGTSTNGLVPIYGTWVDNITKSQFIIPAENLADMAWGTINKMTFYAAADKNWGAAQFEVYMTETSETTLSALADYGTMTKVKNAGSLSISGNQMVVEFDTPYQYMGGNLMIGFLQTVSGSWSGCSWYGVSAEGASMGGYGSSISQQNFLPKTTFDYEPGEEPACMWPTNLAVSNVTAHTAELSWTSDGTAWQIGYSTDGFVTEQYVEVTENPYTLTGLDPETDYEVRVQTNCGGGTYSVFTNPVSFTTDVACPAPTGLAAALTLGNGSVATLSWTSDASAWVVAYKTADATDFTEVNVTENPYTLTSLTPETTYNAKVKAVCGGEDGESSWSNTITFTPTDAYTLTVNDGTTTNGLVPIYGYWCDNTTKSQFIIPASGLADMAWGTISKMTFYASNSSVNWGDAQFEVYMTETDETTLSELADYSTMTKVMNAGSLSISGNQMVVELDAPYQYMGGNLMIGFLQTATGSWGSCSWYGVSATGASMGGYGSSINQQNFLPKTTFDYEPGEEPSCIKPTSLAVEYTGGTEAIVSWTSDATAWNMRVNGVDVNGVITNPYTLTGLELATTYEVEVQANCGSDLSEWAGPVSFTTDACMPEDMTIINYALTDSYGDGWNDNAILVVDGNCNVVETLTITSGNSASGTLKVCGQYVSFMWYNGSYANETSWTFTDAEGTVLFSGTGTANMQNYDVLYVYDNESVKRPSDLVVPEDAIGAYGAKLSWTENGTATAWQIAVYDEEETLVNTVDANSNPFMLTGLQAETNYIVKVRSVTSAGQSAWTCPGVGFTTGVACGAPSALDITPYPISANVDWIAFEEGYDIEWTEVSASKDGGLWLQYDNGIYSAPIGYTTSAVRTWGVMYPAAMLEGNKNLTKVAVYENATYYTCESYTINIYQGIDQPVTLIGTETVVPTGESGMQEITLTAPITLDLTQNLWITMTVEGTYVMQACQSTERNNQWWDDNADGVWTNMVDDNSNLAGYGWMIRGYVEGYDPADFNWTSETNVLPPYTIENLSPETTYFVKVKASCGTEWIWAQFTTPSACDAPVNLTAEAEATSATLNWVGYQDSYNVQYRTAVKYVPVWEDDFENGLDNWTIYTEGESPQTEGWYVYDATNISTTNHSGSYVASAWSWSSDAYDADNWLITPQLDLQGVLKYYVRTSSSYPDSYEVLLSTTDAETTSFTVTLQAMAPAPTNGEWNEVVIDLSAYAGQQGYIAIHHVDYDMNYLFIDDLGIYNTEAAGAWIPVTVNEPTCTLNGLIPETEYEWQVQGINESCDGGLTEWSEIQNFTTLEQTLVTQTIQLESGKNWISVNVEVSLDELKAALVASVNSSGITIVAQDGNTTWNGRRWSTSSLTWDVTKKYIITVPVSCEIALEGMPVNLDEHLITISQGSNWIGYPLSEVMTITSAFAGFATNGDMIKSQDGNSSYARNRWSNNFSLEPGKGYTYVSNQAEDRTLVFPTSSKTGQGVVKSATTGNGQAFKKVHTIDLPREIQSLDQTRKSTAGSRLNLKSKKE